MKTKIIKQLALTLLLFTFFISANAQTSKTPLVLLTGVDGGSYFQMGKDLAKLFKNDSIIVKEATLDSNNAVISPAEKIPYIKVLNSDGAGYNFLKLERADVDVVFMQYDIMLLEEIRDIKRKFRKTDDLRIVMSLGYEQIHLITRKDDVKIKSINDLRGKNVGIGASLSGTNITAQYLKEKTGIAWNDVEIPFEKSMPALIGGSIDAFFFVGAAPITDLDKLSPSLKDMIKLVPVTNEKLKETKGAYLPAQISNEQYKWVDGTVETYGVRSVLVTSLAGMTPEKKAKITEFVNKLSGGLPTLKNPTEGYHKAWNNASMTDESIQWKFYDSTGK